jgi:hypothetical protein
MMETAGKRIEKALISYACISLIFINFTLFSAPTYELKESEAVSPAVVSHSSDKSRAVTLKDNRALHLVYKLLLGFVIIFRCKYRDSTQREC